MLLGAVGEDFADYRGWLTEHGVDCEHVHVAPDKHTARFVCTTDDEMCQIGSFYAGAMAEAARYRAAPMRGTRTDADLVVIAPTTRPRWSSTPANAASTGCASPPTRRSRSPG